MKQKCRSLPNKRVTSRSRKWHEEKSAHEAAKFDVEQEDSCGPRERPSWSRPHRVKSNTRGVVFSMCAFQTRKHRRHMGSSHDLKPIIALLDQHGLNASSEPNQERDEWGKHYDAHLKC